MMNMIIQKNSLIFLGKIKDLPYLFSGYPPHITLSEFIKLNLN